MIDIMPALLIAGGLTIDRFPDGSSAPGGSVLHAGLAAQAEGADVRTLTIAGDEAEARAGLERVRALGPCLALPSPSTTTYRHQETDGRRVLLYEARSGTIDETRAGGLGPVDALLVAPIADELSPESVGVLRRAAGARLSVLLIQGWLRRLAIGARVEPMQLDEVAGATWQSFGSADAIVVSTEDFATGEADPFAQAAAVRRFLGTSPILVLTLGADGYLLDDPAADRVVASMPRHVVGGVPAVGAGDTFGAALAIHLAAGDAPPVAAALAADRVIAMLESRRT